MTDDVWEPSPEELERLNSLGPTSESDRRFVQIFAAVGHALDGCANSEGVALLLSTCRNEFLTANAIFTDLRLALSSGNRGSLFDRYISALQNDKMDAFRRDRTELGLVLSQAREKRRIWNDRGRLWDQYETAAGKLHGTSREDALSVLRVSPAQTHASGKVWDAKYTKMSQTQSHCTDQLEQLAFITARCSAVYSLLQSIAGLNIKSADQASVNETLFDAAAEDGTSDTGPTVSWSKVLDELRQRVGIWEIQPKPVDGYNIIAVDLPADDPVAGWPTPATVRKATFYPSTRPGDETRQQMHQLLALAQTCLEDAKRRLRKTFRPNVSARPLPDPFLVDLSVREPNQTGGPRTFTIQPSQVLNDKARADTCSVATLKVAIPETWHNHEGYYRYNADIADTAAITRLIVEAVETCGNRSVPFLFLPEYFIPREALAEVKAAAQRHDVNLIGGVEGRVNDDDSCVNEALMWFPSSDTELYQLKQGPSVYEPGRPRFAVDGRMHVIRNTHLGTIAAVVCSDFLEADIISSLAIRRDPRLHTLVVVARNPRPEIFTTLARADAVRLYAHVIVVNSTDGTTTQTGASAEGGCIVAAPRGTGLQDPDERIQFGPLRGISVPDFPAPELLIYNLGVSGVFARTNRRSDAHWLTPSVFANQG